MESTKTTLKTTIIFIVLIVATVFISRFYFFNQGYTQATNDVRGKLEQSGIVAPLPKEVLSLFGTIKSIDEKTNTISLDAYPPYDPVSPGSSKTKLVSVVVSSDTEVIKRGTNEVDLLSNKTGALEFKDTPISLGSLRAGDQIYVDSKDNILDKVSIVASKIIFPE